MKLHILLKEATTHHWNLAINHANVRKVRTTTPSTGI